MGKKKTSKTVRGTFEEIKDVIAEAEGDIDKFDNGVAAAGARVRKAAQNIKVLCQTLRNEVTEIKNAR